ARLPALSEPDRVMVAFALPALVLVSVLAIWVHAYANWAAVSFVSAAVLTAAILARGKRRLWLYASVAIGAVAQLVLLVGDAAAADGVALPFLTTPYYRPLGGRAYALAADELAQRVGARTIAADNRGDVAALLYYLRDKPVQIRSWRTTELPHFDLTHGLTADA